MLFNSTQFLVFLPIVVILYFATPAKWRWLLLLASSYYFYMCWRATYALLLVAGTLVDYTAGILMSRTTDRRKRLKYLLLSLASNLGMLFTFKYFNFFMDSLQYMCASLHVEAALPTLRLLLPVGISFYTFQSLCYTIDVYRGRVPAEKDFRIFAVYLSYWPQLVAGPIERPYNLLPQFHQTFHFDYDRVTSGLRLILWGFFKKVVIADNIAPTVDTIYNNCRIHESPTLIFGTVLFAFQIYCDFSGYSDIAIGCSRMLGIRLMDNFRRPYHARSTAEFWKRWHISLSTWFRDYLYIPLGGNRVPRWRWLFNIFFTFLVSGLWHGASWTFVIWGALHGTYLLVGILTESLRGKLVAAIGLNRVPALHGALQRVVTFGLVCFAWVFFRANNVGDAFYIVTHMFTGLAGAYRVFNFYWLEHATGVGWHRLGTIAAAVAVMEVVQALQARGGQPVLAHRPVWVRWPAYYAVILAIVFLGAFNRGQQFIYFQF